MEQEHKYESVKKECNKLKDNEEESAKKSEKVKKECINLEKVATMCEKRLN